MQWLEFLFFKRENLTQPIRRQLSKKLKTFSEFCTSFLKYTFNFKHCEKKRWASYLMYFRSYRRRETWLCKCLKSHVSVHPRTANLLKHRKNCWNMHHSILFRNFLWSWENFSSKIYLLVVSQILGPFVNALTCNDLDSFFLKGKI